MEWLTPFNVPLSIDYANWCLKLDPNAQTNKNITDGLLNINDAEWVKKNQRSEIRQAYNGLCYGVGDCNRDSHRRDICYKLPASGGCYDHNASSYHYIIASDNYYNTSSYNYDS